MAMQFSGNVTYAKRWYRVLLRWGVASVVRAARVIAWVVVSFITILSLLFTHGDSGITTIAQSVADRYTFSLINWELQNALSKWNYRAVSGLPWVSTQDGRQALDTFVVITREKEASEAKQRAAVAIGDTVVAQQAEEKIQELQYRRDQVKAAAEEFMEVEIAKTIADEGLGWGTLLWPPTDFALEDNLYVLAVSPRDRIVLEEGLLLVPDVTLEAAENMEQQLREQHDRSGVVVSIGGVATYPAHVTASSNLQRMLESAAHEWLHGYLAFRPLGVGYYTDPQILAINESLAEVFGVEVGRITYNRLTGSNIPVRPPRPPTELPTSDGNASEGVEFDFFTFMRMTRTEAERLLKAGQIAEAEDYMEIRRQILVRDYDIQLRLLNQAYFAFTGNYAASGSSISPVPASIWDLRTHTQSLQAAVSALENVRSQADFDAVILELVKGR